MADQLTVVSPNQKFVVWGNNIGVAYTSESVTADDNMPQTTSFTKDGDEAEIRDAEGEVQTFVCYNKRQTLDIEVIPTGGTVAAAKGNNLCPAKGSLVTVTDLSSGGHSELADTWICINASQSGSNTSEVRISMSLRQYAVAVATATT
jgi:hypothetical protein